MTNTVSTTSEGLGRSASGRLAAQAEAITKVYGSGDAKVVALDQVTVGIPRGGFIALLVLSVLIAVLGIINTLALSVTERTREIGLLRAVGMSRQQLRRMLRYESVVIAAFGATLGIGIGVASGGLCSGCSPTTASTS